MAGVLVLLGLCGSVAKAYGGEFLFFMPSWRYAQSIQLSRWQRPGHEWILRESQLLIPVFLAVLLAVLLAGCRGRRWRTDRAFRFTVGSAAFLAYMTVFLAVWELTFGGDFFEIYYYFSMFLVPVAFVLPASLHTLLRGREPSRPAVAAALVAAAVPVVLVYRLHVGPVDRAGFYFSAALMGAVLVAAALVPTGRRPAVAAALAVAVLLVPFAVDYASASGYTTRTVFSTDTRDFTHRRAALAMAVQLIDFMRANGLQTEPAPAFWYDGIANPPLNGIQSTYLWGITWVGRQMPRVVPAVRKNLTNRRPPNIVFLCDQPSCSGAAQALETAGYHLTPKAQTVLRSGGEHYWVRAYRIPKFDVDPVTSWYRHYQSALAATLTGRPITR